MNQRSGLKCVVGPLTSHHSTGNVPEFGVHRVDDLIGGVRIAAPPVSQQLSNLSALGLHRRLLGRATVAIRSSALRRGRCYVTQPRDTVHLRS